ncbi:hypothetical protein QZH41_007457 [Actinostola sp. cb2023]|nr:hypothetical protein QZH41_007457 [Actinostola sp. cb2023]
MPGEVVRYPQFMIANIEPLPKAGSHWVGFHFVNEHEAEFFDSYGNPPQMYSSRFVKVLRGTRRNRVG